MVFYKIDAELDIITLSVSDLGNELDSLSLSVVDTNNNVDTISQSVFDLSNELDSLSASTVTIDDNVIATTSAWSSNKIDAELDIITLSISNLNSDLDSLSLSVVDVSNELDTLSLSVSDNTNDIITISQSVSDLSNELDSLSASTVTIDDNVIATTSAWSSNKINTELDIITLSVSDLSSDIDSLSLSVVDVVNNLDTLSLSIVDTNTNLDTLSQSVNDLSIDLDTLSASTATIDDNIIATDSVWSSNKINSELDVITLSVSDLNNELDSLSSSVALNTAKETNVPTSLSLGTVTSTIIGISSDGSVNDVIIPAATVTEAGLLQASDKDKLDNIEDNATADQTDSEIKAAYENNADTNAFTDAEQTKLGNIEANATADQIASEVPYTPATASEWLTVPTDVKEALDSLSSRTGDYAEKIVTESTTSTNTEYFTFTTDDLVAGQYEILVSYVMGHSSASSNVRFRCQVDNTQDIFNPGGDGWHEFEPKDGGTDIREPRFGHRVVTLTAGTHQIDFDYGRGDNNGTSRMYAVHITVKKL